MLPFIVVVPLSVNKNLSTSFLFFIMAACIGYDSSEAAGIIKCFGNFLLRYSTMSKCPITHAAYKGVNPLSAFGLPSAP